MNARPFLTRGAENLFLSESPRHRLERLAAFENATGLTSERTLFVPTVRFPLPVATREDQRWEHVKPDAIWLPLFWLPERVAYRYRGENGEIEDDVAWAIRVMLEVEAAGLYDPEAGTWEDITAGISEDRIHAWQQGAEDEALDSIDLTSRFVQDGRDLDWALGAAQELREVLEPAQWALSARTIAGDIDQQRAAEAPHDDIMQIWGVLAARDLSGVPADPMTGVPTHDLINAIRNAWETGRDREDLLDTLGEILRQVETDYAPYLDGFLVR